MLKKIVFIAIKNLIFLINDFLGLLIYLAMGGKQKDGLTVLLYHRTHEQVPAHAPYSDYNVRPSAFASQMKLLAEEFTGKIITPSELPDLLNNTKRGSFLWITFDDGYKNNLEILPVLQKYSLPATFFVTTDYLGKSYFDFCRFDRWLYENRHTDILAYSPMTWKDCRLLHQEGFELASHGVTHRSLGHISTDELNNELTASKEMIASQCGNEVTAISYPFGSTLHHDITPIVISAAQKNGYTIGCSADNGFNRMADLSKNAMSLKRTVVYNHDRGLLFKCKIYGYRGPLDFIKKIFYSIFGS